VLLSLRQNLAEASMAKRCNTCHAQSMVCNSGRCDVSWLAKAAGWTVVSSRSWYCPACSRYFERLNQKLIDLAKTWVCATCLEVIASQPTQPPAFPSAAASSSQPPVFASAAASSSAGVQVGSLRPACLEVIASQPRLPPVFASAAAPSSVGVRRGSRRPGDWYCPHCHDLQFARNTSCRRCAALKPGLRADNQSRRSPSNLGIERLLAEPLVWSPFDGEWCDEDGQLLCNIKGDSLRWCGKFRGRQLLQRDGHVIKMMMQNENTVSGYINEHGQLQWSDGDVFYRLDETPPPPLQPGPQPNFPPSSLSAEPASGSASTSLDETPPPPLQPGPQPNFLPPSLAAEPASGSASTRRATCSG